MIKINELAYFKEGGRDDGVRLEPAFRTNCPKDNYSALHGILSAYAAALTAAGGDPATQTINAAVTYLETLSNLDLVCAEW